MALIPGFDPMRGSRQSVAINPAGKPVKASKWDDPNDPLSLQVTDRAAAGVGDFKNISPDLQKAFTTPGPQRTSGQDELDRYIAEQQKLIDPGYDWAGDPGTIGMRDAAEIEANAIRSKIRDTLQGSASPMAIARETARWDSQTRGDVLKYIANRKIQAQQNLASTIPQAATLQATVEERQRQHELDKIRLAQNYLRQQQDYELRQERANPFSAQNLGQLGLNLATRGATTVLDQILDPSAGRRDNDLSEYGLQDIFGLLARSGQMFGGG